MSASNRKQPVSGALREGNLAAKLAVGMIAVGAVLRLVNLGLASYQIDELVAVEKWAGDGSLVGVFQHIIRDVKWDHRMPMLAVINYLIVNHLGFSGSFLPEWAARLPHAILGILALPVFWAIGRAMGGRGTAGWALFLSSFSVFATYYAREAYDYCAVIFFSAGVVWTGLELLRRRLETGEKTRGHVIGFIIFSILLLMTHLSGLLFLGCWSAVMAIAIVRARGLSIFKQTGEIGFWALVLLASYVPFLPFAAELVGGFKNMDASPVTRQFSLSVIPAVLGRMGWGESLLPLLLFVAALGLGGARSFRSAGHLSSPRPRAWVLLLAGLAYFAVQGWSLRMGRMEIRYFAPLFPLLVALAAFGLDGLTEWVSGLNKSVTPNRARVAVGAALFAWFTPSLVMVCELHSRGYNYKDQAKWIMERLPENGVYAFYNVYELRGVPRTYPTPGRDGTSVASWSSQQDFDRANPPERARSLFTRFPQVVFMEISPEDVLSPTPVTPPIDRDSLFMRHEWIGDAACDRLFAWRTHPMGEVQWNTKFMHRTLVSYNIPEDLPALAKKRGQAFYHGFGPGWRYLNDQGYNHWMSVAGSAELIVGNVSTQALTASLHLRMLAPPPGCRLHVFSPQGAHLAAYDLNAQGLSEARISGQLLPPGESAYRVSVTPLASGAASPPALLYSIEVELDSTGAPGSI